MHKCSKCGHNEMPNNMGTNPQSKTGLRPQDNAKGKEVANYPNDPENLNKTHNINDVYKKVQKLQKARKMGM